MNLGVEEGLLWCLRGLCLWEFTSWYTGRKGALGCASVGCNGGLRRV